MSENVNNVNPDFYQPVEVDGKVKNFIKNPQDAEKLAYTEENEGRKAAKDLETKMSQESVSSLMDKNKDLEGKMDILKETLENQIDILEKKIEELKFERDVDKLEVWNSSYNASMAISRILHPRKADGTEGEPVVPYKLSSDEKNKLVLNAHGKYGEDGTINDKKWVTDTYSSDIVTKDGKKAFLKLTVDQYLEDRSDMESRHIKLSCQDQWNEDILLPKKYDFTQTKDAARDFIETYKSLNNTEKKN